MNEPLFSNDLAGFMKILAIFATMVTLPGCGLVVYFLKQGPELRIKKVEGDVDGLGKRVTDLALDNAALHAEIRSIVSGMAESQRTIVSQIDAKAAAQIEATHKLELQLTEQKIGNHFAEAMVGLGKSIERMAMAVEQGRA